MSLVIIRKKAYGLIIKINIKSGVLVDDLGNSLVSIVIHRSADDGAWGEPNLVFDQVSRLTLFKTDKEADDLITICELYKGLLDLSKSWSTTNTLPQWLLSNNRIDHGDIRWNELMNRGKKKPKNS